MNEQSINEPVNISAESALWEELSDEAAAACTGGFFTVDALFGILDETISQIPFAEEGSEFIDTNSGIITDIFQGYVDYFNLIDSLG